MAKSNKPIVWFPFAAGGTVIAFFIPVLVLLTLLAALGKVPAGLSYAGMQAFLHDCLLAKLVVFGVVGFSLWSSAHRLRCTAFDFGLRIDGLFATVVYSGAIAGMVVTAQALMGI